MEVSIRLLHINYNFLMFSFSLNVSAWVISRDEVCFEMEAVGPI